MGKTNKDDIANRIRKVNRELDLESDVPFRTLRSKTWDGKQSNKQSRKNQRRSLDKMIRNGHFEEE